MNKRTRDAQRALHLVAAAVLGTYVYSPWGGDPTFAALTRVVLVPVLVLTGLAMWQWPRVGRALRARRG